MGRRVPTNPPADRPSLPDLGRAERRKAWLATAVMCLAVVAVYLPLPTSPDQNTLYGSDYLQMHARRIRYAREALFSGAALPAWYSRELMGTPFWSNVQNFPFIPTRLVLLALDPLDTFAAGVILAAVLSAVFTSAFCRRLGMGLVGAALAGWTFACAGFFACRVNAGHLPLLEAYPLLPLWLWLVEVCRQADATDRRAWLKQAALALAGTCGALAGHPQVPLYAAVVTGLYLLYRGPLRTTVRLGTTLALGMGCGAFAVWPMLKLIGRSTRVLALDPAGNDVTFPYGRLGAFLLPWKDGWPEAALDAAGRPFGGYPNDAYFWDTACYVGWLPLAAAAFLLVRAARRRERPPAPAMFFAAVGLLALLTALPAAQQVIERVPGTILRSPARQVYVTTLALALAAGAGVHVLARRVGPFAHPTRVNALLALALLAHGLDVGAHARAFVRMTAVDADADPRFEEQLRQGVGDGRAAIDYQLPAPYVRSVDDVGVFDSILLATSYVALLDLADLPPTLNVQALNGSDLSVRALESTAVRLVLTLRTRPDLERLSSGAGPMHVYRTRDPAARAAFFPMAAVLRLEGNAAHLRLRDPNHDARRQVIIPTAASALPDEGDLPKAVAPPTAADASSVTYERVSSDLMVLRVRATEPGFLRVIESHDPGWHATVNGAPADVLPADIGFMAVRLAAGESEVRLGYSTPGAAAGIAMSAASLCALGVLLAANERGRRRSAPPSP